jgi:predicted ATPase with chaperone activity
LPTQGTIERLQPRLPASSANSQGAPLVGHALYQIMSDVGLIGGGQVPMPGEVSRAHDGMLLLDARPECRWHVLEGCASRLRTALQESNLASVLDLTALATLAMRGMTSVGSRKPGSTPR